MDFDTTQFNPNDQGEILELGNLLGDDIPQAEIAPLIIEEESPEDIINNTTEEPEEVVTGTTKEDSIFKTLVKRKIEAGEWFDVEGLEDIDVDEEVFSEIMQAQIDKAKEEASENTVKTNTLSPIMLKALEIDKNGGNVSQVFETYKNIYENPENPISHLDLENPADQEKIFTFYHKSKGLGDFEIKAIVESHKKNLTLGQESQRLRQEIDTVFNNYLDQQVLQAEEHKTKAQEALKQYRSSVLEELKKYQINDNFRKTLTDKLSKADEKGGYGVDAIYDEWRRDPEKAAKLAIFLTNEEEYVKLKASKVINEERKDTFSKIKLSGRTSATGTLEYNSSKNQNKDVISLSELS